MLTYKHFPSFLILEVLMKELKTIRLQEEPLCWHPLIGLEWLAVDIGIIDFYHVFLKKCS